MRSTKDAGEIGYVLFVDIAGAFDNVSWTHLIDSAIKLDFSHHSVGFIAQFLSNRTASLNGKTRHIIKGTPQGALLSPLLWKVGMCDLLKAANDIHNCVSIGFADDLTAVFRGKCVLSVKTAINKFLLTLYEWCAKSNLAIKPSKSQLIHFSGKRISDLVFSFDGDMVLEVSSAIYLGSIIDRRLNFNPHLDYLKSKSDSIFRALMAILCKRSCFSIEDKVQIYRSTVVPGLIYSCSNWFRSDVQSVKSFLRSLQRKFLIAISSAYRTTSKLKLYKLLDILPLDLEIAKFLDQQQLKRSQEITGSVKDKLRQKYRDLAIGELGDAELSFKIQLEPAELVRALTPDLVFLLTGHGPYADYLHKRGLTASNTCTICGLAPQTATHLLVNCSEPILPNLVVQNIEQLTDIQLKIAPIHRSLMS